MTDTYAADDYGSISQHLKTLEDARRQTAAGPQGKWEVWQNGDRISWAHVTGRFLQITPRTGEHPGE